MYALAYLLAPYIYWGAAIISVLAVAWVGGVLGLKGRGKVVVGSIVLLLFAYPLLHKWAGISYMNYLCEKDGGEHIYKTVDNVEGIYQMTPEEYIERMHPKDVPVGYDPIDGWRKWEKPIFFVNPRPDMINYQFYEKALGEGISRPEYLRYTRQSWVTNFQFKDRWDQRLFEDDAQPDKERSSNLKSQYAFVFRGIERALNKSAGILGAEWVVIDINTNQILADKRLYTFHQGNIAKACQQRMATAADLDIFLNRVLKPIDSNKQTQGVNHGAN